jgi:hypothetical protein
MRVLHQRSLWGVIGLAWACSFEDRPLDGKAPDECSGSSACMSAQNLRVYACATSGAFSELLRIDAGLDGITLFGGFSCADWSYSTELRTEVVGPGPAAREVAELAVGAEFQNFRFRASDAAQLGQSSIAARVVNSQNARFVAVSFTAGRGA